MHPHLRRRTILGGGLLGLGQIALADLVARSMLPAQAVASESAEEAVTPEPSAVRTSHAPHFAPRAKRVIWLFMHGGPSQVDTFDFKPLLAKHDGEPLPFSKPRVQFSKTGNLLRSPWKFSQHGQCGAWVSAIFPHLSRCVDDLCFIKSMHGSNEAHGGAMLKMSTGSDTFVRPSAGAWISYGLGTENENLPSFISIGGTGHGGLQNFGSAFLPPNHQASRIANVVKDRSQLSAMMPNLLNPSLSRETQAKQLEIIQQLHELRSERSAFLPGQELQARIDSFHTAFRMQTEAPEVIDLSRETEATLRDYGIDGGPSDHFGKQCLLARRLSEAGVRFVQATHSYWDQHSELKEKHASLAAEVDRPIAALLRDLKARGLLKDTLVIWGGEFGRTPAAQGDRNGRDHNPHAFTYWFAGGGVKGGYSHGATDDFGYYAVENKVHVHDYHATLLHLLGIDHTKLTYRFGGRDFRLTDVAGEVIHDILV